MPQNPGFPVGIQHFSMMSELAIKSYQKLISSRSAIVHNQQRQMTSPRRQAAFVRPGLLDRVGWISIKLILQIQFSNPTKIIYVSGD